MVEHGGASHTLGLAFDSRIGNYKNWGYKVGLARITTSSTDGFSAKREEPTDGPCLHKCITSSAGKDIPWNWA